MHGAYYCPSGVSPSLFRKMSAVQGAVQALAPDKTVRTAQYSYTYITESALLASIRPLLAQEKLAVFVSVEQQRSEIVEVEKRGGGTSAIERAEVSVSVTFADGDSGETFTVLGQGRANDTGDKAVYKAITSACRYVWWKTFLVPTDQDDVNESSDDHSGYVSRRQVPTSPTPLVTVSEAVSSAARHPRKPSPAQKQLYKNLIEELGGMDPLKDWEQTIAGWIVERFQGRGLSELSSAEYDIVNNRLELTRDKLAAGGVTATGFPPASPEQTEAALQEADIQPPPDVESPPTDN